MIPLKYILTCTVDSISFKSTVASTFIVANDISAGSIHMTPVNLQYTLIYVCWKSTISHKVMSQKIIPSSTVCDDLHTDTVMWTWYCEFYNSIAQILLVQLTPSPEKPALHIHSKLPKVLMQVAFSWQLSVPSVHSLMSIQNKRMHICASYTLLPSMDKRNAVSNVHIPVQLNPSPVNPVLQLQL